MIRFIRGNLLDAEAEAVVNTVNTVGVMGKGIALQFKEAFPDNFRAYKAACKSGDVRVGQMFVTSNETLTHPKWIINFPTKKHWRHPTKIEWVHEGLRDLQRVIVDKGIRSIAIPPLGCGNGGLDWERVRPIIESMLSGLAGVEVVVYEPTTAYQNQAKRVGSEGLTPARAMIAEMVRRYWILGIECCLLEVQKLAWFLERSIRALGLDDALRLKFGANRYGPYSDRLRHLLDGLDGSYLHCERRLSDARPTDLIWFDEARRDQVNQYMTKGDGKPYREALERTARLVDGFESPLGLELLATVDWLIARQDVAPSIEAIKDGLRRWPGGTQAASRKQRLFDDRLIDLALRRLARPDVMDRLAVNDRSDPTLVVDRETETEQP